MYRSWGYVQVLGVYVVQAGGMEGREKRRRRREGGREKGGPGCNKDILNLSASKVRFLLPIIC